MMLLKIHTEQKPWSPNDAVHAALVEWKSGDSERRELFLPDHAISILYIENGILWYNSANDTSDKGKCTWIFHDKVPLKNAFVCFSRINGDETLLITTGAEEKNAEADRRQKEISPREIRRDELIPPEILQEVHKLIETSV